MSPDALAALFAARPDLAALRTGTSQRGNPLYSFAGRTRDSVLADIRARLPRGYRAGVLRASGVDVVIQVEVA